MARRTQRLASYFAMFFAVVVSFGLVAAFVTFDSVSETVLSVLWALMGMDLAVIAGGGALLVILMLYAVLRRVATV